MLEVLIALSVLSIAGLGLLAVLTRMMVAQDVSSTQTVARLLAEGEVQNAILAGEEATLQEKTVRVLIGQGPALTAFRVEAPQFEKHSSETLFPGRHDMGALHRVKVKVWWDEASEAGPTAVERGRQSVESVRFVYLEK